MKIDELIEELENVKEEHGNIKIDMLKTHEDFLLKEKHHAILTERETFTLFKEELS